MWGAFVRRSFTNTSSSALEHRRIRPRPTYQVSAAPAERCEGGVCCKPEKTGHGLQNRSWAAYVQFSILSPSTLEKWRRLLVTSVAPIDNA
jgi:hypothetical protein